MAELDEDWKKFLEATEEPDEEVETLEEDETEEGAKDDPNKKPVESEESEEEDDSEEDDDDDESEEEDDSEESDGKDYKPRLKQFLNKDGSLDAKKIEDAYIESGKQAVTLDRDLKAVRGDLNKSQQAYNTLLNVIKSKPEIAEALFGKDGAKKLMESSTAPAATKEEQNPILRHVQAQLNRQQKQDYEDFVKAHPEAITDPDKVAKITRFLKIYGKEYQEENNGEIAPMAEALKSAYRFYGWDEKIEKKESVASAAKKAAATKTSGGAKRTPTKKEITQSEQFFADKLGVKLRKS